MSAKLAIFCPESVPTTLPDFRTYKPTSSLAETLGNRRFRNEQLSESTMKRFGYKKNTNKTRFNPLGFNEAICFHDVR